MATQEQVVEVQGREVDLVLGDLFESDASILVLPCSTGGGLSRDFARGLARLGIYPEHLEHLGSAEPQPGVPVDLHPLLTDPDLLKVVRGDADGVSASLTSGFLRTTTLR